MRELIAANETWLTVFQLPAYAPELAEPDRGHLVPTQTRRVGNLAAGLDHLVRVTKRGLKKIQYRPHLVDGRLAETGLTLTAS